MIASLVLRFLYPVIGLVRFCNNGVHHVASDGLNLPSDLYHLLSYDISQASGDTQMYICNDMVR